MTWPYQRPESDVHGDAWFARIRAEHERLGTECPCGNTTEPDALHAVLGCKPSKGEAK